MIRSASKIRVLVTGGPTRAYLDRVRFLSNVSTGGLAYELCRELRKQGFAVSLVVGPSAFDFEALGVKRLQRVETNDQMYRAVLTECRRFRPDFAIFSAAVLDFVPQKVASGKVTSKGDWHLKLRPSPKIIDAVGQRYPEIRRIGFKLEWDRKTGKPLDAFAKAILARKKLEALCVNFLPEVGARSHRAYLFDRRGKRRVLKTKGEIAKGLVGILRAP